MGIREEMEHNNNNWSKSDVEGWRTVPEKKSKARRKRLKIKEPSLETIYEDVSDTEVYFSSGDSDNDSGVQVEEAVANNGLSLNLRPQNQSNNKTEANNNRRNCQEVKNLTRAIKSNIKSKSSNVCCGISEKLSCLDDKDMILRKVQRGSGSCQSSECAPCKKYQDTIAGFNEYFQRRNSIEKPMAAMNNFDLQLMTNANQNYLKRKNGNGLNSSSKELPWRPVQHSEPSLSVIKSSSRESSSSSSDNMVPTDQMLEAGTTSHQNVEATKAGDNILTNAKFNEERFARIEKKMQEASLRLQNLYDNMESLRLDSNMYFCKVIEQFN